MRCRCWDIEKYTAKRLAKNFMKYDEANMKYLSSIRNQEEYVIEARKYIEEIEETMQSDRQNLFGGDTSWDPETIREEARANNGNIG